MYISYTGININPDNLCNYITKKKFQIGFFVYGYYYFIFINILLDLIILANS